MPRPNSSKSARPAFMQVITVKLAASRFLTTSLLIHIMLIMLLGSFVIFKAAQKPEAFIASVGTDGLLSETSEPAPDEYEAPQEFEEPSPATASEPTSVSQASAIQALTEEGSFTISTASDLQMLGNTLGVTDRLSSANSGSGTRGTGGGRGGKLAGSLFGMRIETKKLGVLVDVSGSAHGLLTGALIEVDQSFKGMPIVLVFGCGAKKETNASDFSIRSAAQSEKAYREKADVLADTKLSENDRHAAKESVYGQVAMGRAKYPGLDKYLSRLLRQSNVFWSVADKGVNPRFGTDHAMKFLVDQNVDTIYWFSDCNDEFEIEAAERIIPKLKAKGVRVIAHNFTGNDDAKVNKGVAAAKKIAEETGGSYVSRKIEAK